MIDTREEKSSAMEEAYRTAYDEFRESIDTALKSAESNFQRACSLVPSFKRVEV